MNDQLNSVVLLIATHDKVRALLEAAYPDQIVVEIRETAVTRYRLPKDSKVYELAGVDCDFDVETINKEVGGHGYKFRIAMLNTGELRIADKWTWMDYPKE